MPADAGRVRRDALWRARVLLVPAPRHRARAYGLHVERRSPQPCHAQPARPVREVPGDRCPSGDRSSAETRRARRCCARVRWLRSRFRVRAGGGPAVRKDLPGGPDARCQHVPRPSGGRRHRLHQARAGRGRVRHLPQRGPRRGPRRLPRLHRAGRGRVRHRSSCYGLLVGCVPFGPLFCSRLARSAQHRHLPRRGARGRRRRVRCRRLAGRRLDGIGHAHSARAHVQAGLPRRDVA